LDQWVSVKFPVVIRIFVMSMEALVLSYRVVGCLVPFLMRWVNYLVLGHGIWHSAFGMGKSMVHWAIPMSGVFHHTRLGESLNLFHPL